MEEISSYFVAIQRMKEENQNLRLVAQAPERVRLPVTEEDVQERHVGARYQSLGSFYSPKNLQVSVFEMFRIKEACLLKIQIVMSGPQRVCFSRASGICIFNKCLIDFNTVSGRAMYSGTQRATRPRQRTTTGADPRYRGPIGAGCPKSWESSPCPAKIQGHLSSQEDQF